MTLVDLLGRELKDYGVAVSGIDPGRTEAFEGVREVGLDFKTIVDGVGAAGGFGSEGEVVSAWILG